MDSTKKTKHLLNKKMYYYLNKKNMKLDKLKKQVDELKISMLGHPFLTKDNIKNTFKYYDMRIRINDIDDDLRCECNYKQHKIDALKAEKLELESNMVYLDSLEL